MRYWGDEEEDSIEVSIKESLMVIAIAGVLGFLLFFLLAFTQSKGESPEFTCSPGSTYTTQECQ